MKNTPTDDIPEICSALRPAAMPDALRGRLLAAIEDARVEARAAAQSPTPLRAEFRAHLHEQMRSEALRARRCRYVLRVQYGAAAGIVLCALVGSLFCISPGEPASREALLAVASHSVVQEGGKTYFLETMTISEDDNTVLRVRVPQQNHDTLPEDLI